VTADEPPALPIRRLILWRHGRTEWNATGRFQGQLDPPLDEHGRRQAALAAPLLAAILTGSDTVVVSSDLTRATETAQALTPLLDVSLRADARLREHGLGCWEGLTRDEVADRYPDQYADWTAGRPVLGRGGEEPEQVAARALAALVDLPPAEAAVVVTHGGTANRLMERLLQLGSEHRRMLGPLGNGAWSELALHGGRWRLLRHNSAVPTAPDGRPPVPGAPDGAATGSSGSPEEAAPAQDADAVV
jgi:glucosyl-3-phosphoglycerate phosphatase